MSSEAFLQPQIKTSALFQRNNGETGLSALQEGANVTTKKKNTNIIWCVIKSALEPDSQSGSSVPRVFIVFFFWGGCSSHPTPGLFSCFLGRQEEDVGMKLFGQVCPIYVCTIHG